MTRRAYVLLGSLSVAILLTLIALTGSTHPRCVSYRTSYPGMTVQVAGHTLTHLEQEACGSR